MNINWAEIDAQERSGAGEDADRLGRKETLDWQARQQAVEAWADAEYPLTILTRARGKYVYAVLPFMSGRQHAGVRILREDMPKAGEELYADYFETVTICLSEDDALKLTYRELKEQP